MTLTYKEPTDPIQVSEADMRHHLKYIGCTGGFRNEDGTPRVPSPQEEELKMAQSSEKSPGYHTKTPNKPSGRYAKRMSFYARQRAIRAVVYHRFILGVSGAGHTKIFEADADKGHTIFFGSANEASAAHYEALGVTTAEAAKVAGKGDTSHA